ncbi:DNA mismatch repair protein msh-2 [Diplonema papillatum]|nr:DNA mismatch repair protein msh-2 [Diplonema papillatum]
MTDSVPSFLQDVEVQADVFRFVSRGKAPQNFYQLYGEQVEAVAKEYLHTTAVVKQAGTSSSPCPMINISLKVFVPMAWHLLRNKGMKVEIYEGSGKDWKCVMSASPGRLEMFEARFGSIGSNQDSGCVTAVHWKIDSTGGVEFGCAYVNATLRVLGVAEFAEATFSGSNLESFLMQIGAREAIVPPTTAKSDPMETRIFDCIRNAGVSLEQASPKSFNPAELPDKLKFLLRDEHPVHEILQLPLAPGALAAAISYLDLTAETCNEEQFTLRKEDLSKYMKLDLAAVRAMNIFDDENENINRTKGCVYSFLDNCHTAMGKRLLKVWLTQPLLDVDEITRRQDITSVFVDDKMLTSALKMTILSKIPDLDKILKRLQRERSSLADCLKVGNFIALVPKAITLLEAYAGDHKKERVDGYLEQLTAVASIFEPLELLIAESLEVSENDREVLIKASFDPSLEEIQAERNDVRTQMNHEFKHVLTLVGHTDKEIKLENNPQLGHHFRATKKGMGAVNSKKEMIKLESRKDGLKFTSPGLNDINAQWKALTEKYQERQATLEKMFKDTVASYLEPLDQIAALFSELDIFVSFAVASTMPAMQQFVRPRVLPMPVDKEPKILKIVQGRHPLVEYQLQQRGGGDYVANDLDLGSEGTLLALITGPNMGGKSTFIRTAGVCVLLAQVGMFVPAEEMVLTVCDAVLARLGAADYMSRGVSTFMAEMLETNAILANATSNSFVIIDELGRGTSTHDGYGLAWGIAEHLVLKIKCATLFATHFHELTVMEEQLPHVRNYHVAADTSKDELQMLYQVNVGPCSKSYGINVAQIARFPPAVIAAAKRKTELLESTSNKRRRVDSDEKLDAFLVSWLKDYQKLASEAEPAQDQLKSLTDQFDSKAAEFPQLKAMVATAS